MKQIKRTEKEIETMIVRATELLADGDDVDYDYREGIIHALEWVLGGDDPLED